MKETKQKQYYLNRREVKNMVETITYMYECKYLITYTRYTNDGSKPANQKALDDINTALIRPKNLPEKIYEQYK
jgi:hypothetical protein